MEQWYARNVLLIYSDNGLSPVGCSVIINVKLRDAHAPGKPGTFSPPSTSKETAR